jgi:hypothetical protein
MKVKVLRTYIDKNTGKKQLKNAVLDLPDQRIKEINRKGNFLEVLKEEPVSVVKDNNNTKKENR